MKRDPMDETDRWRHNIIHIHFDSFKSNGISNGHVDSVLGLCTAYLREGEKLN